MSLLFKQSNVISLRTAYVNDDGNLACFRLNPADPVSLMPTAKRGWAPKDFDWVTWDSVWLYRHTRTVANEEKLLHDFPCLEHNVKAVVFKRPPEFRLQWTDSGHSVALYLNGEPWAFIYEETHEGYSKGILKPAAPHLSQIKNPWDQSLFERTFLA